MNVHTMTRLTKLEYSVLVKILDQPEKKYSHYLEHLNMVNVASRRVTTAGFFTDFTYPDLYVSTTSENVNINNVGANIQGLQHGAGFVLFIRNGLLVTLEGYSYEDWPDNVSEFNLLYRQSTGIV